MFFGVIHLKNYMLKRKFIRKSILYVTLCGNTPLDSKNYTEEKLLSSNSSRLIVFVYKIFSLYYIINK
jgi:hypothetical protein